MPSLTFSLVAAAICLGSCFCGGNDDDPIPQRSSYSSSPSTTRIQTEPSYRPPPLPQPPSYTYRPPATYPQTTPRAPAPPDYSCGVNQSKQSSALPQPSIARPASSSSRVPSRVPTERDRLLPPASGGGYGVSTSTRTPSQKQPSSTLTHPSRPHPSFFEHVVRAQPPSIISHVPSRAPAERGPYVPTVIQVVASGVRSDEPATVEDLDFAKKLREQARRRGREMSEARSRAKSAQKKGYRAAAQVHRQEAMSHESAMKDLDKRAAEIIFREKNKNRGQGVVDLHGLYVAEAVQFAKDQVQAARTRGDKVGQFIVGKGLHSDAGGAKIRPALEDYFTKRGLAHSLDKKNAGVLVVRLGLD